MVDSLLIIIVPNQNNVRIL